MAVKRPWHPPASARARAKWGNRAGVAGLASEMTTVHNRRRTLKNPVEIFGDSKNDRDDHFHFSEAKTLDKIGQFRVDV
jgi:hypothetical protein